MYKCWDCKETKPFNEFHKDKARKTGYSPRCKECCKEAQRKFYLKNKSRIKAKLYNVPEEIIEKIISNGCEICGKQENITYIDHCHETGRIRGGLCNDCNKGLGRFKDDPQLLNSAVEYLARTK